MAEYAGLEIRIGGNTTKLNNALKASTKSAAELQRRIRQATRAMQFDPTSLKNVNTRIRITGDRMQSLQSKVQILKTAMQQLGDTMVTMSGETDARSIRSIAEDTENLSLKAKQADERYNNLGDTLAKIYKAWNNLSRDMGSDYLVGKMGFSRKEADDLMKSTTSLREFSSVLHSVQKERASLDSSDTGPLITDEQMQTITRLKELDFHVMFKKGTNLDDMIKEAESLGVAIEESAIENVRKLQKTFKEAQNDKKNFDNALKYDQMQGDIQRIDSEAESLSQTMRKLDDSMNPVKSTAAFQTWEKDLRGVDSSLENVESDLKRTEAALKVDPSNLELAARYVNDLREKSSLAEERVTILKRELNMLEGSGAKEAAESHKDLAKWVEESAESARVAKKEFSDQKATVANLDDEIKSLKQTIEKLKGNSSVVEYSDNMIAWRKSTEKLNKEMAELSNKTDWLTEEQNKFNEIKDNLDKATESAKSYKEQLESLRGEYDNMLAKYNKAFDDPNADYDWLQGTYDHLVEMENNIRELEAAEKGANYEVELYNKNLEKQESVVNTVNDSLEVQRKTVERVQKAVASLEDTDEVKLFKNPTGEIEKLENGLDELKADFKTATDKANELEDSYKAAKNENELAKTAQDVREVYQKLEAAQTSLKQTDEALDFKRESILNPSTLKSIGMTLSATVTPALAALGYKMVDASATVDSAYRDMRKTVDGTEEQFEQLRDSAIEFSRTHVTSADQILQIEALGGELGITTENLETFAEVVSNLDVASNLDTEGAATALGHLANIMHLSKEDYVGFSDALVRLGNNGASTETEIVNIAERIGSMGSIVDMSASDVLAWSSSIASTGQNAEAAGTAISRTMSFFETSVAAAGGTVDTSFESINAAVQEGGDKLTLFASLSGMTAEEFAQSWETESESMAASLQEQLGNAKDNLQMIADVAHMSADEFAQTWESDPTEAMKAFIKGLNDIEGSGGSADKILQNLGITAVRQKQAIEGLMQTVKGLDNNLEMSENAWNGISDRWGVAGDAANEASKKAEGFSGQIQILKNIAQNFLSELGEGAVPWIKIFSEMISGLSAVFTSLSSGTKAAIVGLGGFTAAAGPLLSFTATVSNAKKEILDWANTMISGSNVAKIAFKQGGQEAVAALTNSMTTMEKMKVVGAELGPSLLKGLAVGAIVVAVGVIANELAKLYEQYQDHIAATEGLSNALSEVGSAGDAAASSLEASGTSIREVIDESNAYESRLADLTKTLEESNSQYRTYAGQMQYYADTISDLGDKADRSQSETYKLEAALQAVNKACETHYGLDEYGNIIDTETGKIQENSDAILANIDTRRQQAMFDYYADDYAKATENWAAAQDRVNELTEEQNRLMSEEYHEQFVNDYMTNRVADRKQAEMVYRAKVEQTTNALSNSNEELKKTEEAMTALEGKMDNAQTELDKANQALEEAAMAEEEYAKRSETVTADVSGNMKKLSDAITEAGGEDTGFNAIAEGLDAIGVSAEELGGVDMSDLVDSFDNANGSMARVVQTLADGGVQMNTWNAALEQAPGAAENMGNVTAAAFDAMYTVAGQDINATMTLIAGLDVMQIGPKTFYVGDNGTIIDEQGKVYSLSSDLALIPDSVITTYYANDQEAANKALAMKAKLQDVNNERPTPKVELQDNATDKAQTLQNKLNTIGSTNANPSVGLRDWASGGIRNIADRLRSIDGSNATVTVTTVEKKVKQATGGLNNRPVIPQHAQGYIATGPTMTNQGWIGEDGIEAVVNWATGGAVVPLTNKKYMLPIADAIAEGMSRRVGTPKSSNNITINVDGSNNPEIIAHEIADRLRIVLNAG